MWATWQLSSAAGIFLGANVPPSWSLDFAIPLTFMALLVPTLRDNAAVIAALTGGAVATIAVGLPFNLGLVLAAISGIGAGLLVESMRHRHRKRHQTNQ
jgi:predicted branched-subunit amino acid permease